MTLEHSQTLSWLVDETDKTTDVNKAELLTLLKLIHAPTNLHLLFQALKNLPFVLAIAQEIHQEDEDLFPEVDFASASTTCKKLIDAEGELSRCAVLANLFPDPERSIWSQLHGILESHPLYCCLCFQPDGGGAKKVYRHLLAQVFLATHLLESRGTELSGLKENFFSVRKLAEKKSHRQLLTLPDKTLPAPEYLAVTRQAGANSPVRKAGLILQRAFRGARRRKKPGDEVPNRGTRGRLTTDDLEDYEHPEALSTGGDSPTSNVLTKRRARQYASHGGTAAEFTGGTDEVPVALPDERVYSGPTLRELAFQGKQRSNQEAMKNQFSPTGWNELSEFELHVLLRFLRGEAAAVAEEPQASLLRDHLSLMFWLSAPMERVLSLGTFAGHPTPESGEGLYLLEEKTLLARLHSPGPPLESPSINTTSKLAIPVSYHSHIPLPRVAPTETLLRACRQKGDAGTGSSSAAERSGEETDRIKRQLKVEFGNLNKSYGTRLSPGRIDHYWLHALGMEPGEDPPSSLLFFGHLEKFSVARMHYTCAPAQRMETTYRRLCSNLLHDLDLPETFPSKSLVNEEIYLGTPFCPKRESIRDLVKSLSNAVKQSRPRRRNLSAIKNFHNHYAVYTACLIAFATTYRAVRDPSLPERDIDFATGLGVVSDKDDETFYHSRFVWIAEVCRKQIVHYRRHLQRLYELFALQSLALFNLFNQSGRQGRPLNLFFLPRNDTAVKLLRPGLLERLLKDGHGYDLPANAHRHYLKNELLRSSCSPEIIEAQLGHWEQGQEPWNRFSNLHPREFSRQLDLHLTPILERDGWEAIEGYTG